MLINAVFEGGGVKAIGLVGAVKASEEKGIAFQHVAGTSSGSIIASLLAAGYSAKEMEHILSATPFSSFLPETPLHRIKVFGPLLRLFIKKGLYSGERLEYWVKQLLLKKGICTFGDLEPGKLRIIASDISRGRMLILPDDIAQYGIEPKKFPIAKAVRMSCSLPYFFDPVRLRYPPAGSKMELFSQQWIYIVDGGLLSNFPLWLFDEDDSQRSLIPTIGYQLVGKHERVPRQIYGPFTMFQALISTMLEAHDERYIEEHNRYRTIKVPTMGVNTTEFHISADKSKQLYTSGYEAAMSYFDRWSIQNYTEQYQKLNSRICE